VHPGDLIVGDEDGVAVIPCDEAEAVLIEARKVVEYEKEVMKQIDEGTLDRKWIDEALSGKGFTPI
jgi:regulator of RNase E activity RraA